MDQESVARDRYASPQYLANYLMMEWGDLLFPQGLPDIVKARTGFHWWPKPTTPR